MALKTLKAWSIIKEGQYTASSDWWTLGCVSDTKKDALATARSIAGGSLRGSGLRAVKINIEIQDS